MHQLNGTDHFKVLMRLIKGRRSVRSFKPDPVPDELIEQLIEAARWAPSAGNLQPWVFYVVRNPEVKQLLSGAALNQYFITTAPVVIVICAVPERSAHKYGERGRHLYCLQDTALAGQNLMLAAAALGLGTCWVGAFDETGVREALGANENILPVGIVPVGYPASTANSPVRRGTDQVTRNC